MLPKALLRVSRSGGGYRPEFVDESRHHLADRVLQTFDEHVGSPRSALDEALSALEQDADDFKLVRGFAALCERDATFETDAPIPPERVRRIAFEAAESIGSVATDEERTAAIDAAADRLAVLPETVEEAVYADRDRNQRLASFEPRWTPETLCTQYNLSLAQTALFDATEIRVRTDDPKALVSAMGRLRLMYEIERSDSGRAVVITGPDAIFRRTRRYGTAFARLLRSIAGSAVEWELVATIDDRGRERTMRLSAGDVTVPGTEPIAQPTYDSGVEADFAARFQGLDLDWELHREPEPLETGTSVMIPDFAFEYTHTGFRVYFEVMGFWTPEYVEKKLNQLADVEDVELLVAVDESLGVSEEIEGLDHRAIPYSGTVRVKDVVDVLSTYEDDLLDAAADALPTEITPEIEVISLESLAAEYGVATEAIASRSFPEHEQIGQMLIRPSVLTSIDERIETGMAYEAVESIVEATGATDVSAVLSRLGYRVVWDGLSGGTVERRSDS